MIPYGTRVPVPVRRVANCYTLFVLLFFTCVACSRRVGRPSSPRRRRSAVLVLPATPDSASVSPTSGAPTSYSTLVPLRAAKHSSVVASGPGGTVKQKSQQRYSLSAIVIPRLSISGDVDSAADTGTGELYTRDLRGDGNRPRPHPILVHQLRFWADNLCIVHF